jgi:hypothetical protein
LLTSAGIFNHLRALSGIPERDDERLDFERLLHRLDNDDQDFDGDVEFGRDGRGVLSDHGAQRLGQSLLRANAHGHQIHRITICPYHMTADADQYDALLEFFATGQYRSVELLGRNPLASTQPPGMLVAMEHIAIAMMANQQQPGPALLKITKVRLTMQTLHLVLQYPWTTLVLCQMEAPLQLLVVPHNNIDHNDRSPERGTTLHLGFGNDWSAILQAATILQTNVTMLQTDVSNLSVIFHFLFFGRLDWSSVIAFVAAQPNGMDLTMTGVPSLQMAVVEHFLADVTTQCPGMHGLLIQVDVDAASPRVRERFPRLVEMRFPRLVELVSNSALTRFELRDQENSLLNQEQEQQITVITQRNIVIPVYLQTTNLLKPRRPLVVNPNDPPIVVYADHGPDRNKHLYVLSHALSQAAVHPIFFSHFYEYVRNHPDQLPRRQQAPAAAAAAQPPP